jgi:hypothetical protein
VQREWTCAQVTSTWSNCVSVHMLTLRYVAQRC